MLVFAFLAFTYIYNIIISAFELTKPADLFCAMQQQHNFPFYDKIMVSICVSATRSLSSFSSSRPPSPTNNIQQQQFYQQQPMSSPALPRRDDSRRNSSVPRDDGKRFSASPLPTRDAESKRFSASPLPVRDDSKRFSASPLPTRDDSKRFSSVSMQSQDSAQISPESNSSNSSEVNKICITFLTF